MEGFFTDDQVDIVDQSIRSKVLRSGIPACGICKLYRDCESPKMKVSGSGKQRILIVAEAPGSEEDLQGTQFVGKAGKLLRHDLKTISTYGVDLDEDCWKTNALICRPPGNKTPTTLQVDACRPNLLNTIKKLKPKIIILLGASALESFLGHRWPGALGGINKWRGWHIPDREVKAWVCPTYHPSYILRQSKDEVLRVIFRQDLRNAVDLVHEGNETFSGTEEDGIQILGESAAKQLLKKIIKLQPKYLAFDYETTGIKPQADGHDIISCAISYDADHAFAFKMTPSIQPYWKKILQNPYIGKFGANIKFEHLWTRKILNYSIRGWSWDTQLVAHILDNRVGISSLAFQVYVQFGVMDYSSEVSRYLKSNDKNGNGMNKIHQAPMNALLKYNGLDALFTYKLAMKQSRLIR